jgi:hypothetical protein
VLASAGRLGGRAPAPARARLDPRRPPPYPLCRTAEHPAGCCRPAAAVVHLRAGSPAGSESALTAAARARMRRSRDSDDGLRGNRRYCVVPHASAWQPESPFKRSEADSEPGPVYDGASAVGAGAASSAVASAGPPAIGRASGSTSQPPRPARRRAAGPGPRALRRPTRPTSGRPGGHSGPAAASSVRKTMPDRRVADPVGRWCRVAPPAPEALRPPPATCPRLHPSFRLVPSL